MLNEVWLLVPFIKKPRKPFKTLTIDKNKTNPEHFHTPILKRGLPVTMIREMGNSSTLIDFPEDSPSKVVSQFPNCPKCKENSLFINIAVSNRSFIVCLEHCRTMEVSVPLNLGSERLTCSQAKRVGSHRGCTHSAITIRTYPTLIKKHEHNAEQVKTMQIERNGFSILYRNASICFYSWSDIEDGLEAKNSFSVDPQWFRTIKKTKKDIIRGYIGKNNRYVIWWEAGYVNLPGRSTPEKLFGDVEVDRACRISRRILWSLTSPETNNNIRLTNMTGTTIATLPQIWAQGPLTMMTALSKKQVLVVSSFMQLHCLALIQVSKGKLSLVTTTNIGLSGYMIRAFYKTSRSSLSIITDAGSQDFIKLAWMCAK